MKLRSKKIAKFLAALLAIQFLNISSVPVANAVLSTCDSTNFTIEEKHNSVFYFDNGTTITANYVQFKITNKANSTVTGYYAKLDNFSGGSKLSLANYEDASHPFLAALNQNDSVNMYWYLKTSGTDNGSTTFDISIYSGSPSGSNGICKITSTITKVDSTISANANKLTSVVYQSLPTANSDGSATFTATVKGQTGTIGAGPTGAKDVNLSPATTATFDARKFRLSGTSYRCGTSTPVLNQLYIPNACSGNYTAVFTYQYLTSTTTAGATETLSPIMQIASGSQMKHTSTPSFTIAAIGSVQPNQVTTLAATNIGSASGTSSATLNGNNDVGTYTSTYFCIRTTNPGANFTMPCPNGDKVTATSNGDGTYYANKIGLTTGSTYYFEFIGENSGPTYTQGGVLTFVASPYDTTTDATNISATGARLNGTQTGLAAEEVNVSNSYFYYGTTNPASGHMDQTSDTQTALAAVDATTNLVFRADITGLTGSTTYYYELVLADGNGGTYLGGVKSFTTLSSGAPAPLYVVTFNVNGGTGSPSSSTVTQASSGSSVTLATQNTLEKSGYTFGGWNESNDGTYSNYDSGTAYTPVADITLYAKWTANKYQYNANTGTGGPTNQTYAGSTLQAITNAFTAPAGYTFDGWCTVQLSPGTIDCSTSGTKYAESANLPTPSSATIVLYAIWKTTPSSGGGGSPAPVYVPHPPTITSISAAEVCAITPQLVIKGTWLTGATAKVDGVAAQVLATSQNEMTVVLPSAPVGTKTITVTNADGSATTTVKYAFADTPIYVDYIYPETFKDRFFSYIFKALDAVKYEISGTMPAGLTLNSTTGELSGAPTQEGNFVFQIIASNICASTPLIVYMFVDKAIPTAFTCSVAFNVPSSNNITEAKLTNLRNCLSKTSTLSPKYINPVIFISGGLPAGLTSDQALTHPRYLPILDVIVSMNLNAQIYYGAFNGSTDSVQLNVYWPDPS